MECLPQSPIRGLGDRKIRNKIIGERFDYEVITLNVAERSSPSNSNSYKEIRDTLHTEAPPRACFITMNSDPVEPSLVSSENKQDNQVMYDIDSPHHNDVLCGRGVSTNRHSGNESFRSLVGLNKELYVTSTKRQKMAISRSIVEAVRSMSPPGRFLEKNLATNMWADIGDRKAIEKTSQALRDGAAILRKQLSQDLNDPDFLSAVFDMDSSSTAATLKDKEKPTKTKIAKKGMHRRVKSNPDVISAAKQKALVRKVKSTNLSRPASPRVPICISSGTQWPQTPMSPPRSQPPTVTPMSPPHSQPRSQRPRRVSRSDYPDFSQSAPHLDPTSPSPPPMAPPRRSSTMPVMPVMRSASFESPHLQHFEELRTTPRMSWHYSPRHFGPGHHPPLSPQSGYMSPNRPEYMSRNPMPPGGHPMSPRGHPLSPGGYPMSPGLEYVHRPPMSPGMNRSWSPQSYTFGQYPAMPQSSPGPGWRSPISLHRRYGNGELAVPALVRRDSSFSMPIPGQESAMSRHMPRSMPMLGREESTSMPAPPIQTKSSPMCMSPMQMGPPSRYHQYHSCPSSPADFLPPPRQSLASSDKSQGTNRDCPTTMSTNQSGKSKSSSQKIGYHSSQSGSSDSPTSTTVVVCGVMDESRLDKKLRPEGEVISTDERFDADMNLDYTTEEEDFEPLEDLNNVSSDSDAFSPLPFDHVGGNEECNEESYMDMNDDLFQMPIAPCEGDCGYLQERD